nr:PREDICTED: integrin alpha-10 [Lepisosteus oculatus]
MCWYRPCLSLLCPSGLCLCFNVDVKRPRIFSGPADALFGYSVLQHEAEGQKWMLVGAPWDGPANNRKGDVYKCIVGQERNSNCTKVNLGEVALQNVSRQLRNSHLGMTLSPSRPDGFVACAPLWSQECGTSVFSTGICASVDNSFQPKETIAPTAQSTTQEPVPGPARISHGSRSWPRWVRSMHHSQVGIAQCRTRVFSSGQSGTEIGHTTQTLYNKVSVSQIGSYFGSEVCPVDVNRDGVTDVLLVAAPMYLGSGNKEAGRVYVYTLSRVLFTPNGTLQAHRKAQDARFGYAMAMVPDLNHDGYNDLLVGAPLEDGHRGAVYIYHGYGTSIVPQYKQRIPGSALSPGLQYFGRSVSSRLDLDGDELLDLAVGAQGSAVLLSSRSIVQINVTLSFQPHSINVIHKNCQRGVRESACLNATVCFHTTSRSPGTDRAPFDLHVGAMLDDRKFMTRALFDQSSQRQIQTVLQAQIDEVTCSMLPFHVFDTADYIRPIGFALRFRINDTESGPVLDEGWPTFAKRLIPFFKDCGEDDVCVTDLVLHAHMDVSGSRQEPYIVRSPRRRLAVELVLENRQENAYNTSLRLLFSRNLHFSSLSSKDEPQVKMECTALSSNSHSCNVSYPVFRSQAKVCALCLDCLFLSWSSGLTLSCVCPSVCFHSDSAEREETLHDNTAQLLAMVLYEPDLFITSDSNLNRYEVHPTRTPSEGIGPEFHTNFKVQNLGCYPVSNLELRVRLPSLAAADGPFLSVSEVTTQNVSGVNCSVLSDPRALRQAQRDVRPVHPGDLQHAEQLVRQENGLLTLTPRQAKFKAVKIFSSHSLAVPESSMLSLGPAGLWRETVLEVLKGRSIPISLWILIGSIIGGLLLLALIIFLLWKLGFFSRKQREEEKEADD